MDVLSNGRLSDTFLTEHWTKESLDQPRHLQYLRSALLRLDTTSIRTFFGLFELEHLAPIHTFP